MTSRSGIPKEMDSAREVAAILLARGAVSLNPEHPFVFASGILSPIYCDLRLLMAHPADRRRVVELLVKGIGESCDDGQVDVVAGVATAGIPWAAWIAERLGKPMAYVRDAPKGHGKGQQVEGGVGEGAAAVVIEDLTSTGASALNAAQALRDLGASADYCFSIFTYEFAVAKDAFNQARVHLASLCGVSMLLEVATAGGRITRDQEATVRQWLASQGVQGKT